MLKTEIISFHILKEQFDDYTPTANELSKTMDKLQDVNRNKGKVTYTLTELNTVYAIVHIKPELVLVDDMDLFEFVKQYVDENGDEYDEYEEACREGEKRFLQDLTKMIAETPVKTHNEMPVEGYKIVLEKNSGQWQVLSKKTGQNYDFDYIKTVFRGGLKTY